MLLLASCSSSPQITYTISGDFIVVENPEPEESVGTDAATIDASLESESDADAPLDPSSVLISVTYENTSEDGESEVIELASGSFVDGKISFIGKITEPTRVKISADVDDEDLFSVEAVLTSDQEIKFALMDFWSDYPPDQLVLVEGSHLSKDASKKFTITADLSGVEEDLSSAIVSVFGTEYDEEGERQRKDLGRILLVDKKFMIEGDVDEPTFVNGFLSTGGGYHGSFMALVEPNAQISVFPHGNGSANELLVTSDSPLHQHLIESWQQSEEYLSAMDAYTVAYEKHLEEWEAESSSPAEDDQEGDMADDSDAAVADESGEAQESEEIGEILVAAEGDEAGSSEEEPEMLAAEGCEHVAQEATKVPGMPSAGSFEMPEYYKLYEELGAIRGSALQEIARNFDEPSMSLLAMEMGAFGYRSENRSEAFQVYDKLAELLDAETVARRVTPARETLAKYLETEENDASLSPGQKAPEFTLANLEGGEVALYDVLDENEVTLIDFWASWCGPCIADFPELKRLYAAYDDFGFEIIGVSIDSDLEDWEQGSIDNELPWIDLGEMDGWEGTTASTYGVLAIPKGYLIDSEGCILEKNIRPSRLEQVLVARYGEVPDSSESDAETESADADVETDEMGG